jgi:hypothetical protein
MCQTCHGRWLQRDYETPLFPVQCRSIMSVLPRPSVPTGAQCAIRMRTSDGETGPSRQTSTRGTGTSSRQAADRTVVRVSPATA